MRSVALIVLIFVVFGLLAWFLLSRQDSPSSTDRVADSLARYSAMQTTRINNLEAARRREVYKFDSLQRAYRAKTKALIDSAADLRTDPVVVEIVRTVPQIREILSLDESIRLEMSARIGYLETAARQDQEQDSIYELARDSLDDALRSEILAREELNKSLQKRLKRAETPLSLGASVGPGVLLTTDGQVRAGLAATVGLSLRFKIRSRRD